MSHAPPRRLIAPAVVAIALVIAPRPAIAQAPDPRLEVWLHAGFVGVQSTSTARPSVRLVGPDGQVRASGVAAGAAVQGRWQVDLSPEADLTQRVLVRPGDRVEVTQGNRTTTVVAPEMTVVPDPGADRVRGVAPPGALAVYVQAIRDELWFDPPLASEVAGPIVPGPGGAFVADFAGKFDVAPGTVGQAIAVGADGHYTVFQFAPPSVTIGTTQPYAIIRATPPDRPTLYLETAIGTELFRSVPAYPVGGATFYVPLVQDGIVENGIYVPGSDETVVLRAGGEAVLTAPLPRVLASIDPAARDVWGLAPPGARTVVTLDADGPGPTAGRSSVTSAGADGAFTAAFDDAVIEAAATVQVHVQAGQGVARFTNAGVPRQSVLLYGSTVAGAVPGWDALAVEQRDAAGDLVARAETTADAGGAFTAELITPGGRPTVLRPWDRLSLRPALGRAVEVTLPELGLGVAPDKRSLAGRAPAGSEVVLYAYPDPPNYFAPDPYAGAYAVYRAASDTAGDFAFRCQTADCALRYGLVAHAGATLDTVLQWIDAPFLAVGATVASVLGRATAGLPLAITPIAADGSVGETIHDVVRPNRGGGFPSLEVPIDAAYPDGLAAGDRVRITLGEGAYDVVVPPFTWRANPAADRVTGTGPALRPLLVAAFPRLDVANRPAAGAAQALIGSDGRWEARFAGFDLRSGDDLELYVLDGLHYVWWSERAIVATEPEPTLTPAPTTLPSATPAPTPAPRPPALFLPLVRH